MYALARPVTRFVTPGPEISSQCAVSGALVVLYFFSVGLAYIVAKKKDEPEETKPEEKEDS